MSKRGCDNGFMTHLIIDKITVNFHEVRLVNAPAERCANVGFATRRIDEPQVKHDQTEHKLSALPHCLVECMRNFICFSLFFFVFGGKERRFRVLTQNACLLLPLRSLLCVYFRAKIVSHLSPPRRFPILTFTRCTAKAERAPD